LSGLTTLVVNTSGSDRVFGFLGPHGRRLSAGAQHAEPGNLVSKVAGDSRHFAALQRALDDGALTIVSTPDVLVFDSTRDETKALALAGGTLTLVDPGWGAYSSSEGG